MADISSNDVTINEKREIIKKLIYGSFDDCFECCSAEHYKYCDCMKEQYEEYANKALEDYKALRLLEDKKRFFEHRPNATEEDFLNVPRNVESAYRNVYNNSIKEIASKAVKNNIRCVKERRSVINLVTMFVDKYEYAIDDPIFVEIIKSVLNHSLVVYRLKKVTSDIGVYRKWFDKDGNERISISPLLEAQREFDKVKVDSLMILDKKLNGDKSKNVNVDISIGISDNIKKAWELRKKQITLEHK